LAIKLGFPTNYFDKLVEKKNQGMCKWLFSVKINQRDMDLIMRNILKQKGLTKWECMKHYA
jgi:hypothetical protein